MSKVSYKEIREIAKNDTGKSYRSLNAYDRGSEKYVTPNSSADGIRYSYTTKEGKHYTAHTEEP